MLNSLSKPISRCLDAFPTDTGLALASIVASKDADVSMRQISPIYLPAVMYLDGFLPI